MTCTCGHSTFEADPAESAPQRVTWSGPICLEGVRTGDGREILANALRWDTLPIPLRWAAEDNGEHLGAVVVGKIIQIERADDGQIIGTGEFDLDSDAGREAFRQVQGGWTPGVSVDLDDLVLQESDDFEEFIVQEGRIRAATLVAIPAFEGARISVQESTALTASGRAFEVVVLDEAPEDATCAKEGCMNPVTLSVVTGDPAVTLLACDEHADELDGSEPPAADEPTTETFNWVDDVGGLPQYIKRISKHLRKKGMTESHAIAVAVNVVKKMCSSGDLNFPGAQEVNAGSRAEACAAVAEWEEKKARAKASQGSTESMVASAHVFEAGWFENPGLSEPTPLTVTDEGRVYGHIACWDTCHIASPEGPGVCTAPPRSASNYAYFRTGAVATNRGDLAVGKITMSTVHAGPRLSSTATAQHYENTGNVAAYVTAGEDAAGIWVAGAVAPDANQTGLKGAPISGDWRTIGGNLELVGALAVNVPGFPVPRAQALVAGGAVRSLVASGVVAVGSPGRNAFERGRLAARADRARREKVRALSSRVRVLSAQERVRRATSLSQRVARFAGNQGWRDQLRIPKGNKERSGRWTYTPWKHLDDLTDFLGNLDASVNSDPKKADALKKAMAEVNAATEALGDIDSENFDVRDPNLASAASEAANRLERAKIALTGGDLPEPAERVENAEVEIRDFSETDWSLFNEDTDIGGVGPDITDEQSSDIGVPEADNGSVAPGPTAGSKITATDREDLWSQLNALPPGSEFTSDDGEFMPTYRKNDDGTWEVIEDGGLSDIDGEIADPNDPSGSAQTIDGGDDDYVANLDITIAKVGGSTNDDDSDDGAEAVWEGFEKAYGTNADPDVDASPDELREVYDAALADGQTPEEAIQTVRSRVDADRLDAVEAPDTPAAGSKITATDREDLWAQLNALPPGSEFTSDDGEFMPTYRKNDDGTWEVIDDGGLSDIDGAIADPNDPSGSAQTIDGGDDDYAASLDITIDKVGGSEEGGAPLGQAGDSPAASTKAGNGTQVSAKSAAILDKWVQLRGSGGLTDAERATLRQEINTSGEPAPGTLYRGTDWPNVKQFKPGQAIDFGPSSSSLDPDAAEPYAGSNGGNPVVFEFDGARGLNVADRAEQNAGYGEQEWITSGRFYVSSVEADEDGVTHVRVSPNLGSDEASQRQAEKKPLTAGGATFAYNDAQWRMPRGNGPKSGQWIDMPDVALGSLADTLGDAFETADVDPDRADRIGRLLEEAQDAGDRASNALRNADGPGALQAAAEADDALGRLESDLQDLADGPGMDDDTLERIGGALEEARVANATVKDSDLSLLGDKGIGGDAPETDIGGENDSVVGDAPKPKAKAPNKVVSSEKTGGSSDAPKTRESIDSLESSLQNAVEGPGVDDDRAERLGAAFADAADAAEAGDFDAADEALGRLEADLMDLADGEALDEDTLADIGDKLNAARDAVEQERGGAPTPAGFDAPSTPEADAPSTPEPSPSGSQQQKAARQVSDTGRALEQSLMDAADVGAFDDLDAESVGEDLADLQEKIQKLQDGIEDGAYNAADLAAVQAALSGLEANLMAVAEKPGLTDDQAAQIGSVLDDLFSHVGNLANSLTGETTPPAFGLRRSARRWLGRKGIRLTGEG